MSTTNIFQEIQNKRNLVKNYANKAFENGWISQDKFNEIIQKIDGDMLTIGVIGQMKCGKSTFLNALIFKDEILPAATTPMTASLSVITYGKEKMLEAEFYTNNEWEELNLQAARSIEEAKADKNLEAKIKAAKEIVSKSLPIKNEINFLLGTKKVDQFENLIDYVGADGKYIALTKSVRIEYPLDYLKGVEIVDTPGFNDPFVSREERTNIFLSKADAVVMLLYAGRIFDATDKDIIFNKLRTIGIGKLLIGVNKYDLNYQNGELEKDMVLYVKKQLILASKEYDNSSISELVNEQEPLLLSANMALMSQMDISKIKNDTNLSDYYKKALDVFEISTQKEMFEKSLLGPFEDAIKNIVFNGKDEILLRKPINLIKQTGENLLDQITQKVSEISNDIKILEMPDDEKQENLIKVEKAKKKIARKINYLADDIKEILSKEIKKITNYSKDNIDTSRNKCIDIINDSNAITTSHSSLKVNIDRSLRSLERLLRNDFTQFNYDINSKIQKEIKSFLYDAEEVFSENLEDFETEDSFRSMKSLFLKDVFDLSIYDLMQDVEKPSEEDINLVEAVLIGVFAIPIISFNTLNFKSDYRDEINDLFTMFIYDPIRTTINNNGEELIENIRNKINNEFLSPIENKLKEALDEKNNKEKVLLEAQEKLIQLESKRQVLLSQIVEMENV